MRPFLSGDDLLPCRVEPLNHCWWCGSRGQLTHEHKFKRSDLERMRDGGLVWGSDDNQRLVRSTRKSSEVRFGASLCARCNNERSQPFDVAWQKFSDQVWRNPPAWHRRFLDLADTYGEDWPNQSRHLACYVAKHIGCRMADESLPVPSSLVEFMDGGPVLNDVQMVLFKSEPHYELYQKGLNDGIDARGLWLSPAAGAVSRSGQCLSMYSSGLIINYIGIFYRWERDSQGVDPFYLYRRARLHPRHRLPEY